MSTIKRMAKVICVLLTLGTIITLPASGAEENLEEKAKLIWAENTAKGIEKGLSLRGVELTDKDKKEIYQMSLIAAAKVLSIVKDAGVLSDYYAQLTDREIHELDKKALEAMTMSEVYRVMCKQLVIIDRKYPKLYAWMKSENKATAVVQNLMLEVALKFN